MSEESKNSEILNMFADLEIGMITQPTTPNPNQNTTLPLAPNPNPILIDAIQARFLGINPNYTPSEEEKNSGR